MNVTTYKQEHVMTDDSNIIKNLKSRINIVHRIITNE